jgi:hypothetical protein
MSQDGFVMVEGPQAKQLWKKLHMGATGGRSEAWLRDALHDNPELVPVADIDVTFGPLVSVCTELPTDVGPIDNVFINSHGRLTLVECKLWKNAEARRKLIAQVIDYASQVSRWDYSRLQAAVNQRTGSKGNYLFDLVKAKHDHLAEAAFVDATNRALREARFLLLLAGDGIRSEIEQIAELLKKNAGAAYSFGMFEVALYESPAGDVLAHPRVIAKTHNIERIVVVLQGAQVAPFAADDETAEEAEQEPSGQRVAAEAVHAAAQQWFAPVISAGFSDPNQEPARYYWPHNARAPLPWPGTWILGYKLSGTKPAVGVSIAGRSEPAAQLRSALLDERSALVEELPEGTEISAERIGIAQPMSVFPDDDEARAWLIATMDQFSRVFRPRVAALRGDSV